MSGIRVSDLAAVVRGLSLVAKEVAKQSGIAIEKRIQQTEKHGPEIFSSFQEALRRVQEGGNGGTEQQYHQEQYEYDDRSTDNLNECGVKKHHIDWGDVAPENARSSTDMSPTSAATAETKKNQSSLNKVDKAVSEGRANSKCNEKSDFPPTGIQASDEFRISEPSTWRDTATNGKRDFDDDGAVKSTKDYTSQKPLWKNTTDSPTFNSLGKEKEEESNTVVLPPPHRPFVDSSLDGHSQMKGSQRKIRAVPSTPLARILGFGQLAVGIAMGSVTEAVLKRVREEKEVNGKTDEGTKRRRHRSPIASNANAERLAKTLCRMRGAALKLGQMLSIQDESILSPELTHALQRVRAGADIMPSAQLHRQLCKGLGDNWRDKLEVFDDYPIAAASIGQVHRATLIGGEHVAMKVQYPGVADSIESDLSNLHRIVTLTNLLPPGLFVDRMVEVAKDELVQECNYELEAQHQEQFASLISSDPELSNWVNVPKVYREFLSNEILTTELVSGLHIDQAVDMSQETRNHIARLLLSITVKELFEWRFMQTDPNWSNFLYETNSTKLHLIDFGASREYSKSFMDSYMKLVWAAANADAKHVMEMSRELGFLTGDESLGMLEAHEKASLVVGEPFLTEEPFDFHSSGITRRLAKYGDIFAKHRLTPPPREAYSIHRKLAGAFLMCIKLKAVIPCRDILQRAFNNYEKENEFQQTRGMKEE